MIVESNKRYMSVIRSSAVRRQQGLSLIEILVTLVVVSIGLLGLVSLQFLSMRNANNAFYRQQATFLAEDMLDRIRANSTQTYNVTAGATGSLCTGSCSTAAIRDHDIAEWKTSINTTFPDNGAGVVTFDAVNNIYTITVSWNAIDAVGGTGASLTSSTNSNSFTLKARAYQ